VIFQTVPPTYAGREEGQHPTVEDVGVAQVLLPLEAEEETRLSLTAQTIDRGPPSTHLGYEPGTGKTCFCTGTGITLCSTVPVCGTDTFNYSCGVVDLKLFVLNPRPDQTFIKVLDSGPALNVK
jgi:hypothetical protein